jgi:hypothetical protein
MYKISPIYRWETEVPGGNTICLRHPFIAPSDEVKRELEPGLPAPSHWAIPATQMWNKGRLSESQGGSALSVLHSLAGPREVILNVASPGRVPLGPKLLPLRQSHMHLWYSKETVLPCSLCPQCYPCCLSTSSRGLFYAGTYRVARQITFGKEIPCLWSRICFFWPTLGKACGKKDCPEAWLCPAGTQKPEEH